MTYIKQLDCIRAIAVLLVIITHWFPETHQLNIYTGIFNGVDIFFVLSGFLITKILFENREIAAQHTSGRPSILVNFYIRRFLRIFPIYYLVIFLLYIIGPSTGTTIRENFIYFVTYTSNFYFFNVKHWDGMLSHLWSLSVEEQFYLLWPWLMLYTSRKYLLHVILAAIAIGFGTQLYLKDVVFGDIFTLACFDGFGLGALMAWAMVYRPKAVKNLYMPLAFLAAVAFGMQALRISGYGSAIVPSRTLTSVCTVWLIAFILLERRFIIADVILNNRPLIFIGKISYGIYLYHLMIPYLTYGWLSRLNSYLPKGFNKYNLYLIPLENFAILLMLAYASWIIIEQPLLRLKKRFNYQQPSVSSVRA